MGKRWEALKKKGIWKEIIVFAGLAVLLGVACWQVFRSEEQTMVNGAATAEEVRLKEILEMIDGVGATEVMISESEIGEKGAVIVCEGANNISVLIDVREAAATALGVNANNIKIYLKNKQ